MDDADPALVKKEQHPRNTAAGKCAANLSQAGAKWPAERHTDRPAELHERQISADALSVLDRQGSQPIPHRLDAASSAVENDRGLRRASGRHSLSPYPDPLKLPKIMHEYVRPWSTVRKGEDAAASHHR